jgi:hypothetical protein
MERFGDLLRLGDRLLVGDRLRLGGDRLRLAARLNCNGGDSVLVVATLGISTTGFVGSRTVSRTGFAARLVGSLVGSLVRLFSFLGVTFIVLRIVGNGVCIGEFGLGDLFFGVGDLFFVPFFSFFINNNDTPDIIASPPNITILSILYILIKKKIFITFYRNSAKYFSFNSSDNSSYTTRS